MQKPRFATLLKQAEEVIDENVKLFQTPQAAAFFASGMSYSLHEEDHKDENHGLYDTILTDTTGKVLKLFIENEIKPSPDRQAMLDALAQHPTNLCKLFRTGYNHEGNKLRNQTTEATTAKQDVPPTPTSKPNVHTEQRGSLEIIQGDITKLKVDVIVNAANESLRAGGGVCGAIHAAAGPELEKECIKIGECEPGGCKMTDAYRLPCKKVIHAVGPRWRRGNCNEDITLAACYRKSIEIAYSRGYQSIAFPFISSGIFGYPREECAEVALKTIIDSIKIFPIKVVMCAFSKEDYELFNDTLKKI